MRELVAHTPGTPAATYPIYIGTGIFSALAKDARGYSRVAVVSEPGVSGHWFAKLQEGLGRECTLVTVEPGEEHKSVDDAARLWRAFAAAGLDRGSLVLNLGGGMVGDLGGFAASTYMRGIAFMQIPTSLLAQVDASVGGKVAVNLDGVKNIIGSFSQPRAVCCDIATLSTLPRREFLSGFAEVIKHALIRDAAHAKELAEIDPSALENSQLEAIVERSCRIKAEVVAEDPKEAGLRKILNFGHTFGHAIETLSHRKNHALLHGEAVGLGMAFEAGLSRRLEMISSQELSAIENLLTSYHFPLQAPFAFSVSDIMPLLLADKKNSAGAIQWTLLKGIGACLYNQKCPDEIVDAELSARGCA